MRFSVKMIAGLAVTLLIAAGVYDYTKIGRGVPERLLPSERADMVIIDKSDHRLRLMRNGDVLRSYSVALGGQPKGHKQQEGDRRTPEGTYAIDFANSRSAFHLGLRISYPNAADKAAAKARGVAPGGDIMIHGLPNGLAMIGKLHQYKDWTNGCIAVTNAEIEEIWHYIDVGTTVVINP